MAPRKKILLMHLVGQYPMAGIVWQAAHHLVALDRLGYEVYYIEDSGARPTNPGRAAWSKIVPTVWR